MVTNPSASQASISNEDQDTIGDDRSLLSKSRSHNPPRLLSSSNGNGVLNHSQSAHAAICLPQHGDVDSTSDDSSQCGGVKTIHERGNWSKQLDFFLSCVGYAVGLGNIWRFPYLCYESGGGAFLVPYLIFLVICGLPLFFLEMSFGQFASLGPVAIWKISPMFKGLGYGMVIISGIVCIYYNVIIAWTLYYTYQTFGAVLPWATCGNEWNSANCVDQRTTFNSTLNNNSSSATTLDFSDALNGTNHSVATTQPKMTSSEEFWLNYVLRISSGIEDMGEMQWPLVLTLFLAWVVVFLCLMKGIKSSGKVVYFSATFPYIVLVILLIRGVTLPGAKEGILFYLTPRWELLKSFKVWGDAATQIFYSVGASWGAVLTMASYNRFNNNCYRDALIIPVINCATSVFAGFVVFSIIGFMAYETGKPIEEVVSQGPGLAFVVYPEAVSRLPISPLWALLFFIMLFTIGLDSQFGMFEAMISAFVDEFPVLRKRKMLFIAFMCVIMFFLGLPCVTQGGMYVLKMMDWYSATFSLMIISFFETIVIGWIYGADRFLHDIFLMTKKTPPIWWKLCWRYITPIAIACLLVFIFANHTPVTYGSYVYPNWSIGVGWMMALCSLIPIPLVAIYQVAFKAKGTFKERILESVRPAPEWGPHAEENRLLYRKSLSAVSSRFKQTYVAGLTTSESETSNGKLRLSTDNMLSPLECKSSHFENESKV